MNKQKGQVLLIVILVVTAIAGIFVYQKQSKPAITKQITQPYSASSASDETANWKTYTNTKYGVTIKYPVEWKLSTDNYLNTIKDYIIFSIYQTSLNDSRIELYKDFQGGFCEGSKNIKSTEIELTNRIQARKIECSLTIAIHLQKNGNNLWLIATNMNDNNRSYFNQIISTFKFTDQSTEEVSLKKDLSLQLNPENDPNIKIRIKAISGNFAIGVAGDIDGVNWIAMKQGNKWQKIWDGVNYPSCSVVNQFKIPKEIYGECYDYK